MTGQQYGMLTVVAKVDEYGLRGGASWLCVCECGQSVTRTRFQLTHTDNPDCGNHDLERRARFSRRHSVGKRDFTGQTIHRLFVKRRLPFEEVSRRRASGEILRAQSGAIYECECVCGTTVFVAGINLRLATEGDGTKGTRSCGCLQRESAEQLEFDMEGKRYGRYTVLERVDDPHADTKATKPEVCYRCRCDCGVVKTVHARSLRTGHVASCGCFARENASILGTKRLREATHYKAGRASIGGTACYFRSGWEREVAQFLHDNGYSWSHEPTSFELAADMRYTPDFFLPDFNVYLEVKGRLFEGRGTTKIDLFRKQQKLIVLWQREIYLMRRKPDEFLAWLQTEIENYGA